MTSIDIDDTSRCPKPTSCDGCGTSAAHTPIRVTTASTPLGTVCLALCEPCAKTHRLPRLSAADATRHALEHAMHLGVTLDETTEPEGDR